MKNKVIIVVALFLSLGAAGQIDVRNLEIRQNGNTSEIVFDARIDNKATGRNYKLVMTPILYNDLRAEELPPIIVETRRTRIMDYRNGTQPFPGAVYTENGNMLRYAAVINNSEWLSGSDLRFDLVEVGCCKEHDFGPLYASSNSAPPPPTYRQPVQPQPVAQPYRQPVTQPQPVAQPYSQPVTQPVGTQTNVRIGGMIMILEKNAATLPLRYASESRAFGLGQSVLSRHEVLFTQGSSTLDPYAFDNYRILNDIINVFNSSEGMLVGKIEITGYASPEGTQASNYNLANNRALAVRNFILDNIRRLRPANFDIINGGENWEGLYKLVEESRMDGRWQVIDIIERTPYTIGYSSTSRKQMLMDLNGGQTWRNMLANFFPQLRSAATVTFYMPTGGSMTTTPGAPPQQNTAIINRAIDLIGERNSSAALALLTPVADDPRAWNPMGVCYLLESNMAKAREYFRMAADAGYSEAKSNLEQINW